MLDESCSAPELILIREHDELVPRPHPSEGLDGAAPDTSTSMVCPHFETADLEGWKERIESRHCYLNLVLKERGASYLFASDYREEKLSVRSRRPGEVRPPFMFVPGDSSIELIHVRI